MKLIAHRGNWEGKNSSQENKPAYIDEAIKAGYDVEVDVWYSNDHWYLGHDKPTHVLRDLSFLQRPQIWCHAKNIEGYMLLYTLGTTHVFWHNKDEFSITSRGIKWANYGVVTHDGIMVLPELHPVLSQQIRDLEIQPLGICCDDFSFLN